MQEEQPATRHWSGIDKQAIQGEKHIPSRQKDLVPRSEGSKFSLDTAELFWQILPHFGCARFNHLSQAGGGCFPTFIFGTRIFSSKWWSCCRGSAYKSNILPDGLIKEERMSLSHWLGIAKSAELKIKFWKEKVMLHHKMLPSLGQRQP